MTPKPRQELSIEDGDRVLLKFKGILETFILPFDKALEFFENRRFSGYYLSMKLNPAQDLFEDKRKKYSVEYVFQFTELIEVK